MTPTKPKGYETKECSWVRFQSWRSGKSGVPLYHFYSQVHSDL